MPFRTVGKYVTSCEVKAAAIVLGSCIPGKGITVLVGLKPEEVSSTPFLVANEVSVLLLLYIIAIVSGLSFLLGFISNLSNLLRTKHFVNVLLYGNDIYGHSSNITNTHSAKKFITSIY